jgi:hypothetical protein
MHALHLPALTHNRQRIDTDTLPHPLAIALAQASCQRWRAAALTSCQRCWALMAARRWLTFSACGPWQRATATLTGWCLTPAWCAALPTTQVRAGLVGCGVWVSACVCKPAACDGHLCSCPLLNLPPPCFVPPAPPLPHTVPVPSHTTPHPQASCLRALTARGSCAPSVAAAATTSCWARLVAPTRRALALALVTPSSWSS